MLKPGCRSNLGKETLTAERGTKVGVENLYCDVAIVLHIAREVDRGHAARSELTLDFVAARECIVKVPGLVAHQVLVNEPLM